MLEKENYFEIVVVVLIIEYSKERNSGGHNSY